MKGSKVRSQSVTVLVWLMDASFGAKLVFQFDHCVYVCLFSLLERLVLVLSLVLHHQLATLTHGEGEGALDVLRITQLVHVLPENLSQVRRDLLVKRDLHQLQKDETCCHELQGGAADCNTGAGNVTVPGRCRIVAAAPPGQTGPWVK